MICPHCHRETTRLKIRGTRYKIVTDKAKTRRLFVVKKPKPQVLEVEPIPMLVVVRADE
jgi:hypothetical protein